MTSSPPPRPSRRLPRGPAGAFLRWAGRLRFPYLAVLTAVLFGVDLFVPDVIPFADEVLLGLATLLFATWRKRSRPPD